MRQPTEHRMTSHDGTELFYRAWPANGPTDRAIVLDHPWLIDTPCALPQATASYNPNSVYVPSSVLVALGNGGVNGELSSWSLMRGDGLDFPAGASYHVLVDPQQSRRCTEDLLFVSDIE